MDISDLSESLIGILNMVRVAKALKDHGKGSAFQAISGYPCDPYFEQEVCVRALEEMCCHFRADYDEENEIENLFFSDHSLMEYYRLCREHARLAQISFERSPWVARAVAHVREWLDVEDCYYCSYELKTEPGAEWGCGIQFQYDASYFWEFPFLALRMLAALAFYEWELPTLRVEVDRLKRPYALVLVPPKAAKEAAHVNA